MVDISTIMASQFVRVKLVALVHFIFIGNAMLGTWIPYAYSFYNILFMVSLIWMLHSKESVDAAQTLLYVGFVTYYIVTYVFMKRRYENRSSSIMLVTRFSVNISAVIVDASSIFFDLTCIISFFNLMNGWVIVFSIINLLLRPFSLLLLYREFTERGGNLSTATIFPTNQQRSYEDIDRPNQPVPTNSQPPPNVASIF